MGVVDNLLQSQIFFIITSVAVVFIAILLVVALIYIIGILYDMKKVSRTVKDGAEMLSGDMRDVNGKLRSLVSFVFKSIKKFLLSFNNSKKNGKKE